MPTKNFKVQLSQAVSNPVLVTIQVDGNTVFNSSITSEAVFDLAVPAWSEEEPATVTNTWSIAVSGGPITIQGILNNYSGPSVDAPGSPQTAARGASFLYDAGLIVTQPTFNGVENLSLYNVNSYLTDGTVTGSGALPIPNATTCVFDLNIKRWSEEQIWSPTISYAPQRIVVYNEGYFVSTQRTIEGTLPTDTNYWATVTVLD